MSEVPDHAGAREEFTNIRVTREGRWFTGPKEIVNLRVISHFKQNLFRDAKGIYIFQTFHQFSEKGYITVEGPLLSLFRIDAAQATLDNLDVIPIGDLHCLLNIEDDAPYIFYERLNCYATIPAGVSPYFSEFLEEQGDGFVFCGRPVERRKITQWA